MAFTKVKNNNSAKDESMGRWDAAIHEARSVLAEFKVRVATVKAAIRFFERQKEAGES